MKIKPVKIGNKYIGPGKPCFFVSEIGINHNGNITLAKKLIDIAKKAGSDAVKFQKRSINNLYKEEELKKYRESPFGKTYGEYRHGIEFNYNEYKKIDICCKKEKILWFTSCWDIQSVDFMEKLNPPCYKIASASLTNHELLKYIKTKNKPIIMSTGMSTMNQIDKAVKILGKKKLIILHCTSSYPAKKEELNLKVINFLINKYKVPIGYSGHETLLAPSLAAVSIGASIIERHITMDRAMIGSDHAASLGPDGLWKLIANIKNIETSFGDGKKRIYKSEIKEIKRIKGAFK